jgi:hypothetical protein
LTLQTRNQASKIITDRPTKDWWSEIRDTDKGTWCTINIVAFDKDMTIEMLWRYDHLPQSMEYITRKLSAQSNKWLLFYDILVSQWQVKISMKLKLSCYNMHEEGEAVMELCYVSHNHFYMFLPLRVPYIPTKWEVKNMISL